MKRILTPKCSLTFLCLWAKFACSKCLKNVIHWYQVLVSRHLLEGTPSRLQPSINWNAHIFLALTIKHWLAISFFKYSNHPCYFLIEFASIQLHIIIIIYISWLTFNKGYNHGHSFFTLQEFIANEGGGEAPLEGSIPDMTSSTEWVTLFSSICCHFCFVKWKEKKKNQLVIWHLYKLFCRHYVNLQKIYQAKAEADFLVIEQRVRNILKKIGRDPDSISKANIKSFSKNARKLTVSVCLMITLFSTLRRSLNIRPILYLDQLHVVLTWKEKLFYVPCPQILKNPWCNQQYLPALFWQIG